MPRVSLTKPQAVQDRLAADIQAGVLGRGDRLPGEHALAERFAVSRSTVRQALVALQRAGFIVTQAGSGSFVTYDGHDLAATTSWAAALAAGGVRSSVRVLRFELVEDARLAVTLGLHDQRFLAVDRVRSVEAGAAVSLEHSRLPVRRELDGLREEDLLHGSLTETLEARGLRGQEVEEWASLVLLDRDAAAALDRVPGEPWLQVRSVARDGRDAVVEHVTSWLDPARFHLHHVAKRRRDS